MSASQNEPVFAVNLASADGVAGVANVLAEIAPLAPAPTFYFQGDNVDTVFGYAFSDEPRPPRKQIELARDRFCAIAPGATVVSPKNLRSIAPEGERVKFEPFVRSLFANDPEFVRSLFPANKPAGSLGATSERKAARTSRSLAAALALAEQGFAVTPLRPGTSEAFVTGWPEKATSDIATLKATWPDNDCNVGIATGRLHRDTGKYLFVLDEDNKNGKDGATSLRLLEAINGELPNTLTVRSPSGLHRYFLADMPVGSSHSKIGKGLDIKGWHGQVAAPGSVKASGEYAVERDSPIADASEWLVQLAGAPRSRAADNQTPVVELDTPARIQRAIEYLTQRARDHSTYVTACRVKDIGISRDRCFELLMDHWPPAEAKGTEHVQFRVDNAYFYGQNAPGTDDAEGEFSDESAAVEARELARKGQKAAEPRITDAFQAIDTHPLDTLRPRDWLHGKIAARRNLTLLIAPPGTGKSTLCINVGLAGATGRNDITGMAVPTRHKVALWNQEDDSDETARRVHAAMRHFEINPEHLRIDGKPAFLFASGVARALVLATVSDDQVQRTKHARELVAWLTTNDIGLLILDPLLEFHSASENDNVMMGHVAREFRRIAVEANCAVIVVHHTRKAPTAANRESLAGDMDGGRGASAVTGVARIVTTLYGLDQTTAARYGVPEADRHRYVRLDDAKANMSLLSGEPVFFYRESVRLGEDEETVGVLRRVILKRTASAKELQAADEAAIRTAVQNMLAERPDGKATAAEVAEELISTSIVAGVTLDSLRKRIGAMFPKDGKPISARTERVEGRKGVSVVLSLAEDAA